MREMCANYTPVTIPARLKEFFQVAPPASACPDETWPGSQAPFIRQAKDQPAHAREASFGLFGLIPRWAKDLDIGRHTYNARSETVADKPSFRDAWRHGRRGIVPVESFFEPNWETSKSVRWRIHRKDNRPMGLAGLWDSWSMPDGRELLSFTMLTINADGHVVMQRFHKPGDEKRMVVVLDESDYDRWLDAPKDQMSSFLTRYPVEAMAAEPAPLLKRASTFRPAAQGGDLFAE